MNPDILRENERAFALIKAHFTLYAKVTDDGLKRYYKIKEIVYIEGINSNGIPYIRQNYYIRGGYLASEIFKSVEYIEMPFLWAIHSNLKRELMFLWNTLAVTCHLNVRGNRREAR